MTTVTDSSDIARRSSVRRSVALALLPYLIIVFGCLGLGAFHSWAYPRLGPIDEQAHIDYLFKIRDLHIPRTSEKFGQAALNEEACRGFDSPYVPPPCTPGQRYDPSMFQYGGVSAAAAHPPVYYGLTAVLAAPLSYLPKVDSFVTAARIATTLWLAAALSILWWLFISLGATRWATASVLVIAALAPQVIYASVTINPDTTAMLAGSLALAVALKTRSFRLLALVGVVAVSLKATNVLGVVVASVIILAMQWNDPVVLAATSRARRLVRRFGPAVVMMVGAAIAAVLWAKIVELRRIPNPPQTPPIVGAKATVLGSAFQFFPPTVQPPLPPFFALSTSIQMLMSYTNALLVASPFGAALLLPVRHVASKIGWAALMGMVVGPGIIMVSIWVGAHDLFSPPSRYGLSLVPFLMAPLALLARSRASNLLLVAFALSALVITAHAISQTPFK